MPKLRSAAIFNDSRGSLVGLIGSSEGPTEDLDMLYARYARYAIYAIYIQLISGAIFNDSRGAFGGFN